MDVSREQNCRTVSEILSRIGGKWTVLVISRLGGGPLRFGELKRQIDGISQKMLTSTLRDLEMDGMVNRTVTPVIPPRVDYELTPLGRDLLVPLRAIGEWAVSNRGRVLAARARFFEDNPGSSAHRLAAVEPAEPAPLRQAS